MVTISKNRILISFALVIIFFLAGFFLINQPAKTFKPENIKYVKIAGQSIKVDLALTPREQNQGLSGRAQLNETDGMLFVFDKPGEHPFWMKDMNFPIDIIWIGEDMTIVYIKKDALPESYPQTYGPDDSKKDAKYVLEVVAGFGDKNNLQEGDKVEFIYQ